MKLKELIKKATERGYFVEKLRGGWEDPRALGCDWQLSLATGPVCKQDPAYFVEGDQYCGSHAREVLIHLKEDLS